MNQSSIAHFALVQGFLKFGLLAALLYILLAIAIDGTLASVRWPIVIGFPIVGIAWGLFMWLVEQTKRKS